MKNLTDILVILLALTVSGCVERLISVTSNPPGAVVWLNGEEAGATPVNVPFTFYGTYDVTVRKDGYQTIKTSRKAEAPVYQWLGLDLICEILPVEWIDEHHWDFQLSAHTPVDPNDLTVRAQQLRDQTLLQEP